MPEASDTQPILALIKDLMFSSRISAAGRAAGRAIHIVGDPAKLAGAGGRLLLVDLHQPGAIDAAVAWKGETSGRILGFASHVDADTIAKARAAGFDQVLARSAFVSQLDSILKNG